MLARSHCYCTRCDGLFSLTHLVSIPKPASAWQFGPVVLVVHLIVVIVKRLLQALTPLWGCWLTLKPMMTWHCQCSGAYSLQGSTRARCRASPMANAFLIALHHVILLLLMLLLFCGVVHIHSMLFGWLFITLCRASLSTQLPQCALTIM